MTTAPLRNFLDSYVRQDRPDETNYLTEQILVGDKGTNNARRGYIYIPLPLPLTSGAPVTSAQLILTSKNASALGTTIKLERVLSTPGETFTVSRVRWNNEPAIQTGSEFDVRVTKGAHGPNEPWVFDVTEHIRDAAKNGEWYGWRIRSERPDEVYRFYSRNYNDDPTLRPKMDLVVRENPKRPTSLSPGGERVISLAKPTLRFAFQDVAGEKNIGGMRVFAVLGGTEAPDNPPSYDWDSGIVPVVDSELDLDNLPPGVPAFPDVGLGAAGRVWWQVIAYDRGGLPSPRSAWAGWRRLNKISATMTTPSADGVTIEDATMTSRWTIDGSVQQRDFSWTLADRNLNRLWTTGILNEPNTRAVTVPKGFLRVDDRKYYAILRIWDAQDREEIDGDLPYEYIRREFIFDRDGSLTPVTNLTATPTADGVGVILRWERPTLPLRWAIVRDGEILDIIDRQDLFVGGGWYEYTDWTQNPNRPHQYEVAPVTEAAVAKGGPKVTITTRAAGVWLVDPSNGNRVAIKYTGPEIDLRFGEDAVKHIPDGSRKVVIITTGQRGYEMDGFKGYLRDQYGQTAQGARDRMLRFKEAPPRGLRFVAQDNNFPINIWGIDISLAPQGGNAGFGVTFNFAQNNEYDYESIV